MFFKSLDQENKTSLVNMYIHDWRYEMDGHVLIPSGGKIKKSKTQLIHIT